MELLEFVQIPLEIPMVNSSDEKENSNNGHLACKATVKIPFYIGKYPVTQKHWKKVMGNNPLRFEGENRHVESIFVV